MAAFDGGLPGAAVDLVFAKPGYFLPIMARSSS
jgi:hypothetical protein